MKKILFFILLLCSRAFCQQDYAVAYDYKTVHKKHGNHTIEVKTYLHGNGKISFYEEDFKNDKTKESENNFSIKVTDNPIFYKELASETVIFEDQIKMKFFNIKDSIAGFDWKITAEKKTVLGYTCQKATLNFRGRNYDAYFTDNIPYQDGPWKFSGLPGMILEVQSDESDMTISIVAEKVEFKKSASKFENPYLTKKIISYNEFVEIYNKKYYEFKANQAQDPYAFVLQKGRQELYVTD